MDVRTTRFGDLSIAADEVLCFPAGLIGFEQERDWVLLVDAAASSVGWLQSCSRPELALAVVSPRRFAPEFELRVARSELAPLHLASLDDAQVLAIVGRHDDTLTLNLRAPLVINTPQRLGRQVIGSGEGVMQQILQAPESSRWRMSA